MWGWYTLGKVQVQPEPSLPPSTGSNNANGKWTTLKELVGHRLLHSLRSHNKCLESCAVDKHFFIMVKRWSLVMPTDYHHLVLLFVGGTPQW